MASSPFVFLVFIFCFHFSNAGRPVTDPVNDQTLTMSYHKGALLTGSISVNFIWYGKFTPSQRTILTDLVTSLSSTGTPTAEPSVATWWNTVGEYYKQSNSRLPKLTVGDQTLDEECSLGKSLSDDDIEKLAAKGSPSNAVNVVLTSADVAVRGFCMSRCGTHAASNRTKSGRFAYVWVGNSVTQCPGQCAWPFHQPVYGPQTKPLVAPNGDVGVDGMVINLAKMLAGTVTNPFGDGFFQGPKEAPLEAASACPGVYGSGAYPGYPGTLLVDPVSGASYNANGARGRKYLLPALMKPATSQCSTLV